MITITVLAVLIPKIALGDNNMNLSGSVNLNEFQNISTNSLLLSTLASLAESIIPILVGAVIGHKAIRYWHTRKNEIATRDSIISDYAQSFKLWNVLQDNFVNRIFESCVTFEKDKTQLTPLKEYSDTEYDIQGFLRFPQDSGELPSSKHIGEYMDLIFEIDKTSHIRAHLYSSLQLYKDSERIMSRLENIGDLLSKSNMILNKFFHSTNADDFVKFHDKYLIQSKKISVEIKSIDSELVQLRFR